MTRFWDILLFLDNSYPKDQYLSAIIASRSMVHFIERMIYPLNFRSEFSRLIINVSKEAIDKEFYQKTDPAIATVNLQLDLGDFLASEETLHAAFAKTICLGVETGLKYVPLPSKEIMSAMEEFIENGCVSQWVHIDKTWKRKDIRCVIECDHKTDAFYLTQKIYKSGELCVEKLIGKTLPREWLMNEVYGKAIINKGNQVIYSKGASILSRYDIDTNELEFPESNIQI